MQRSYSQLYGSIFYSLIKTAQCPEYRLCISNIDLKTLHCVPKYDKAQNWVLPWRLGRVPRRKSVVHILGSYSAVVSHTSYLPSMR